MSKIIKRQIKKTMPWFLIFNLILSSTVVGVVFNYDFEITKTDDNKVKLTVSTPQVEAQADTAITSVVVRNAAPEIITGQEPYEDPISSSTSPINVGDSISFKTTATDAESNDYYLIVCTSAGAAPGAGGAAPSCNNGINDTLCVSGATVAGNEATCTDAAVADPGAEALPWYAYVCDNHATEADCSGVSQGNTGDDDASPMYVNHAPTLDSVLTSIDNQAPGGTFQFTATSTDTDVAGSNDEIILHICRTNSYSTTTGCAAGEELCTSSGVTDGSNEAVVSCTWDDTAPTADMAYDYYAFIKDWHEMPASVGQGTQDQYTIINVAPTVSNVDLNWNGDITLNMKGSPEVEVTVFANLADNNTSADITSATSSIFWSAVTDTLNCAADDDNCYQLEFADCAFYDPIGATVDMICTTTMAYHALPTDAASGSIYAGDHWEGGFTVVDDNGDSGSGVSGEVVEVVGALAIGVEEVAIPYRTIRGGQNSEDYNATTTVVNYGNVPMDTNIEGTNMIHDTQPTEQIPDNQQRFDLSASNYTLLTNSLSSTTPFALDVDLDRPTSSTDVENEVYWGIAIPAGTISGDYAGTNTFTAINEDGDANWN